MMDGEISRVAELAKASGLNPEVPLNGTCEVGTRPCCQNLMERCLSGRKGSTGNRLVGLKSSPVSSNLTRSAIFMLVYFLILSLFLVSCSSNDYINQDYFEDYVPWWSTNLVCVLEERWLC